MPLTQFNLPVPKGTRVSSEYGPRTISKNDHKGIDFEVSVGTKVTPAASGRVIRIIPGHGEFGNVVVVQHGDDQATLYAHLSRIDVTIGQDLAETSQIGLSGNTGRSKGSHLHFEIIEGSSNIAAIRNAQEIGLPGVGIGGAAGRANPRQFFDHYTDTEFQTLVSADKSGKDLLTGDKRKNRMVGNDNDNNLDGLAGSDTYEFGFGDTVTDLDGDGMLKFNGNVLQGVMKPKGEAGDRWEGDNCDLVRQGSDLVLVASGYDAKAIYF